jgi:CheY-like chemotaxis protein
MALRPILLVEDNPDDEILTLRAFRKAKVANEIIVARDGVEALQRLLGEGEHHGKAVWPQLVLLDLKLPKVDGLAVLRRIRAEERLRVLPVVILTSSRETRDLTDSYQAGASSFIRKPVDFERFLAVVQTLVVYWATLNEPPP